MAPRRPPALVLAPEVTATLDRWLVFLRDEQRVAAHTLANYQRDVVSLLAFLGQHWGTMPTLARLATLTLTDLRAWQSEQARRGLVASSRSRARSAVRHFFQFLDRAELVHNNAPGQLAAARRPPALPHPISPAQAEQLLLAADQGWVAARDRALLVLLYGTGLRISEALGLNGPDWPTGGQELRIRGKGGKTRLVPILPAVADTVDEYRKTCPLLRERGPLFIGVRGDRLQAGVAQKMLRQKRAALGLPAHLTPHALRHSFASHLLGNGADLRVLQELLGHSSLSSTQIYTKLETAQLLATWRAAHPRGK